VIVDYDDEEFAVVIRELAATGMECLHKMDGTIIVQRSRWYGKRQRGAAKAAALTKAEEKRARKAAKLGGKL
jgi:hypothetical protein